MVERQGGGRAKAKVTTKAKLEVETKVKDNDLATCNPPWRKGQGGSKGKGEDRGKAEGGACDEHGTTQPWSAHHEPPHVKRRPRRLKERPTGAGGQNLNGDQCAQPTEQPPQQPQHPQPPPTPLLWPVARLVKFVLQLL